MKILNEDSRQQLISKSKSGQPYKTMAGNRFTRRTRSKISQSTKEYNEIDMNKLFKKGILDVQIKIMGETDTYKVRISFGMFTQYIQKEIKKNNDKFEYKVIVQALTSAINDEKDVYVFCSCKDWHYRFGYFATINNIIIGPPENIP